MRFKITFRPFVATAALLAVGLAGVDSAVAESGERAPVVLELFTSQGCSSCPSADAYLGELAKRDDVLPLSMHVDYWNYIGWVDPYATEANTARQKAYMHALRTSYVYTPQLVVDGQQHVVGSDREAVEAAIEAAKTAQGAHLKVEISEERGGRMRIRIPEATLEEPAVIMLVAFDREHVTNVQAGENAGREITNYRVVRAIKKIGRFDGKETEIALDEASVLPNLSTDGCAVLVQSERTGAILGAGVGWMKPAGS